VFRPSTFASNACLYCVILCKHRALISIARPVCNILKGNSPLTQKNKYREIKKGNRLARVWKMSHFF